LNSRWYAPTAESPRSLCSLVRPGRLRYPVASRFLQIRLAMTPLRFANPPPPSGSIEPPSRSIIEKPRRSGACGRAARAAPPHRLQANGRCESLAGCRRQDTSAPASGQPHRILDQDHLPIAVVRSPRRRDHPEVLAPTHPRPPLREIFLGMRAILNSCEPGLKAMVD
jgi:hypothetical protein